MADQDPSLSWVGECALKLNAGRGQHSGIWPHTWLSHLLNLVRSSHPVNIGPDIFGHRWAHLSTFSLIYMYVFIGIKLIFRYTNLLKMSGWLVESLFFLSDFTAFKPIKISIILFFRNSIGIRNSHSFPLRKLPFWAQIPVSPVSMELTCWARQWLSGSRSFFLGLENVGKRSMW